VITSNAQIGDALKISTKLIQDARNNIKRTGNSFLNELTLISGSCELTVLNELGQLLKIPFISLSEMNNFTPAFNTISLSYAIQQKLIPLTDSNQNFIIVIADPFNIDQQIYLETKIKRSIAYYLTSIENIHDYLAAQEENASAIDQLESTQNHSKNKKDSVVLTYASVTSSSSPAVTLVNSTLYDALKSRASDIHLESTSTGITVKYRIDGVLDQATTLSGTEIAEQVISRIKVLAELDIAERRVPQDGSFSVLLNDGEIDLRVSIMPCIHGEDAVIRILDKRSMIEEYGALTLEALGFDEASIVSLRNLIEKPYGMLMVTGPTGSGKTTTLYAALTELNSGKEKIITIEDPVEYQLAGILQIPVNEKKGLTFAKGLRSILRHDPDKIMVGEIRDKDTAEIAVQSALTGHLVLTTVHANNVFDVFGRFSHLGTDLYAFVSALNGIWAQRLVRINCLACSTTYTPTDFELAKINLKRDDVFDFIFKKGEGCVECRHSGYKGRKAIAEILILDDEIREHIIEKSPLRKIKELAKKNGTRSLHEAALELIKSGETTIEEIKRVTLHV
jgi:general secretion pathway protein E